MSEAELRAELEAERAKVRELLQLLEDVDDAVARCCSCLNFAEAEGYDFLGEKVDVVLTQAGRRVAQ